MRITPALRFFRRQSTSPQAPDPADLGTAFGMEASLEPIEEFRAQVAEYELESQQLAASPVADSPLAWLSRRG